METDFPLNDVLPMKTGLTEEAPFELLFGLRSHAVLLPRNDGDEDCWKKKKRKNNQLINSPKQVSTISFTNETIKVNVNRRTYKVPTIYFNWKKATKNNFNRRAKKNLASAASVS